MKDGKADNGLPGEFSANLVSVTHGSLERGDAVYELVRWGKGANEVKYKKLRVIDSDRGTATVVDFDAKPGGVSRKIRYGDLRAEKRVETSKTPVKLARVHDIAPVDDQRPKPGGDDFQAWIEMGRGLVRDVDSERSRLSARREDFEKYIERIDAAHMEQVKELEGELKRLRESHSTELEFCRSGLADVLTQIARLDEKRKGIQSLIGDEG
jgi:hypothetical protein